MIILNVCVFLACTTCVPGVYGGQKRAWEPLELEFQRVQRIDLGRAVFLSTERTLQHQLTEVPYVNKVCWRNTCMWPSLTLADPCWREKLSHCIYNYLAFKISDFNMLNKNNKPLVITNASTGKRPSKSAGRLSQGTILMLLVFFLCQIHK